MDIKSVTFNETFVDKLVETTDITEHDLIIFTEDVYSTSFFTATIIGRRHILARILKQSFGDKYITFSLEVIECIGTNCEELIQKREIRRREKTIFGKYKAYRQLWNNEFNRCYFLDELFEFKNTLNK
ncbi:hypothetical protein [Clostridium sp.]|uniref:hypothetical protein n=1 Tax=Clostridium sp. TaxID=1506 RepID=UPI002912AF76|nr:hypothetical protein [Clostridium sp.]MDU5107770.1 hypothetical protein [Clostridium sp.]